MSTAKVYLDEKVIELKNILDEIEDNYNKAKSKSSVIDKIIVDIEHEIEFDKPSGAQMVKKYKELQTAFRLRREYKDNVDYFIKFRSGLNIKHISISEKGLENQQKSNENRKYSKRVAIETRDEVLAEFEKMLED